MSRLYDRIAGHMNRRRFYWVVGLLVLIGGAAAAILIERSPEPRPPIVAPQAEPTGEPDSQSPEDVLRALPPREQLARAFEAAFGRRESAQLEVTDPHRDYPDRVEFTPGQLVWTDFGPVLISIGEVVDAAHADSGKVAVHYLAPAAAGFAVRKSIVPAVVTGSNGRVGTWEVRHDLTAFPVVFVEGGGTFQGFSCSILTMLELRPDGPVELAEVPVYDSNSGYAEEGRRVTVEGEVTNVVKNRSFDVRYSGSRAHVAHYEREGLRYELRGNRMPMVACPEAES